MAFRNLPEKTKSPSEEEELPFKTRVEPDIWFDVHRMLEALPPSIDLRYVSSCEMLAVRIRQEMAIKAALLLRSIGSKWFFPLFFKLLKTTAFATHVPQGRRLPSKSRIAADDWDKLFEVPWDDISAKTAEQPERQVTRPQSIANTPVGRTHSVA